MVMRGSVSRASMIPRTNLRFLLERRISFGRSGAGPRNLHFLTNRRLRCCRSREHALSNKDTGTVKTERDAGKGDDVDSTLLVHNKMPGVCPNAGWWPRRREQTRGHVEKTPRSAKVTHQSPAALRENRIPDHLLRFHIPAEEGPLQYLRLLPAPATSSSPEDKNPT